MTEVAGARETDRSSHGMLMLLVAALCLLAPASPAVAAESLVFTTHDGEHTQIAGSGVDGSERAKVLASGTDDSFPAWSPDGRRLAFTRLVDNQFDIFVRERDGSITRITDTAGMHKSQPEWSPDGTQLAFTGIRPGQSPLVYTTTSTPDGSDPVLLLPAFHQMPSGHFLEFASDPVWAADGLSIFFVGTETDNGSFRGKIFNHSVDPDVPEFART